MGAGAVVGVVAGGLAVATVVGLVVSRPAQAAPPPLPPFACKVTGTIYLGGAPGPLTLHVQRGDCVRVAAVGGAQLVSFAPSQAFLDAAKALGLQVVPLGANPQAVQPGQTILLSVPTQLPDGNYVFNVTWRAADNSPQATAVTLVTP